MANKLRDGQSDKSEGAAKAFCSSVSGRTRSKRHATIYESYRTCLSSQNASNASAGVSDPNRQKSSSFNKAGLGRVSTSQGCSSKRKRRAMEPAPRVGSTRKSFGNGNEHLDSEGIELIDKDSYRIQVPCQNSFSSCKEKLNESFSAATPMKDASNVCRREPSAGYCGSFCPEDVFHGSDPAWLHESRLFVRLDSDGDDTKPEDIEVEGIDEAGFRNQKSSFESKIRQSAEQVFCSSCCNKKVDSAKRNSKTSATKVNNHEDTDSEEYGIEEIDEAEFKNKRRRFTEKVDESDSRQFITEVGPSTWQDSNDGHFAATTTRKVKTMSRKNVHEMDSSSSSKSIDSSSSEFNSDDVNMSLQDEEVSTCGAKHETDPGIASRTRSKLGTIKRPAEVGNVSSSLSLDSDSSPTDSGEHSYHDEGESSDGGIEFLGLNLTECEIQNYKSMKVSSETQDCSIKKGGAVDYEENCDERKNEAISADLQVHDKVETLYMDDERNVPVGMKKVSLEHNETECCVVEQCEESNCEPPEIKRNRAEAKQAPTSQFQQKDCGKEASQFQKEDSSKVKQEGGVVETMKFSSRNRQLSHDEGESSDGGIEFLGSNLMACDVQNYKSMKVSAETQDCNKQEGGAVEYESSCDETKNEVISSVSQVRDKTETLYMADEKNVPVDRKQVSPEHNETKCCVVEQSEESNWEPPEIKGYHEEAKQALASQFQRKDCSKEASQFQKEDCSKDKEEGGAVETMKLSSRKRQLNHDASSKPTKERKTHNTSKVADGQGKNEAISPCLHVHDKSETLFMADQTNLSVGRKQVSLKHNDICSRLADAVLERIQIPENKENYEGAKQVPASQTQNILPLKFRFEDEVPELVEKTEYEKDLEEQFSKLDSYWALEELRSFDYPKVDTEKENPIGEETQYARCCRGKHELILEDEEGLICKFCRHVELGPKDVFPEWAERTCRGSERKGLPEMEQLLEFDELQLQSSVDNVADFRSASGTVWSIKPGAHKSMYEHQREGFEFLWKNIAGSINLDELNSTDPGEVGGCIISHAPGTGKTRLTIVFLETYLKLLPNCYPVIIAPASMLLTWEEEFRKWNVEFPFLNLSNVELSAKEKDSVGLLPQPKSRDMEYIRRIKMNFWSKGRRILGISYSLFEKLTGKNKDEKMRKILLEMPGLVVLDEGHTPRNQRSSIWKAFQELKTRKRIILSGTPFQNNFGELFNTLRIVRPAVADLLAQEKMFDGMVATRKSSSRRRHNVQSCLSVEVVDRAVDKLRSFMSPFVHVHKGTILQQSLPGLRDCVVLLKPPPLQKSLIERLEGTNTFKFEHDVALISVHPYLFRHCDATEDQLTGIDMGVVEASKLNHQEGVKTRFIVELIRLSMAVEEKVLIFSQFIQPLQLIKELLKELFQWVEGRQILQMQGNVDLKQRQVLINQFNDPHSESKVMLASTKCCSEGISLVGASRVVLVDVVWNPSVERQAICRAYRIGQKKFVYTYHLMTSGTTEADKYCRQAEKERLSELVFSSSNESNQQKHPSSGIEDRILELMVGHKSLNEMFEKIISQPKDTDLIQTFGCAS